MAKHITVRGAQPHTKEQELERVYITINGCFPHSLGDEAVAQLRQGFKEDAEKLFQALMSLPGGTFCQLLVLMLQEKASQFIVSHKPTAEYRKMEAAPTMFQAIERTLEEIEWSKQHNRPLHVDWIEANCRSAFEKACPPKARGESEGQDG
jgi:hypothetical protein